MFKFIASLIKEFRLLIRDRVGLAVMFLMPIILVIIMTSIQNSTFELVNDNKIPLIILNNDSSETSKGFISSLNETGLFTIISIEANQNHKLQSLMHKHDALAALIIPENFFFELKNKAQISSNKALVSFGLLDKETLEKQRPLDSLQIYFQPVLEETYRYSIKGALQSVLLGIENKLIIEYLYAAINGKEMPADFDKEMMQNQVEFKEITLSNKANNRIPNASEHNVPAWTLFAMFFTIVSLGSNIVKEKLSGSFVRLKVLPTNYMLGLLAKQLLYLGVALFQVLVIFSIGKWVFPLLGLPTLHIPSNWIGLLIVAITCGWSAISFALCIGVFSKTQEQASGFGSVSVVILAAFGGVFVPAFAMPDIFTGIMKLSPFYWGLESFYGLFLGTRQSLDIYMALVPLVTISVLLQMIAYIGLKTQKLI